ncbi:hypothetical protein quinque_001091 [Culex quinquefasciatus]
MASEEQIVLNEFPEFVVNNLWEVVSKWRTRNSTISPIETPVGGSGKDSTDPVAPGQNGFANSNRIAKTFPWCCGCCDCAKSSACGFGTGYASDAAVRPCCGATFYDRDCDYGGPENASGSSSGNACDDHENATGYDDATWSACGGPSNESGCVCFSRESASSGTASGRSGYVSGCVTVCGTWIAWNVTLSASGKSTTSNVAPWSETWCANDAGSSSCCPC